MMLKFKFNNHKDNAGGFTLLEVLAALAIVSVAIAALFTALSQSTRLTSRVEERMVGNWVSSNQLAQLKFQTSWPKLAESTLDVEMAGRLWYVRQNVKQMDDENIRRIDVIVSLDKSGTHQVGSLYGYFFKPKPKYLEHEKI